MRSLWYIYCVWVLEFFICQWRRIHLTRSHVGWRQITLKSICNSLVSLPQWLVVVKLFQIKPLWCNRVSSCDTGMCHRQKRFLIASVYKRKMNGDVEFIGFLMQYNVNAPLRCRSVSFEIVALSLLQKDANLKRKHNVKVIRFGNGSMCSI